MGAAIREHRRVRVGMPHCCRELHERRKDPNPRNRHISRCTLALGSERQASGLGINDRGIKGARPLGLGHQLRTSQISISPGCPSEAR